MTNKYPKIKFLNYSLTFIIAVIIWSGLKMVASQETVYYGKPGKSQQLVLQDVMVGDKFVAFAVPYQEIRVPRVGGWKQPWAIAFDSQNQLYVVDRIGLRIYVFDSGGRLIRQLPENRDQYEMLKDPTDLFINNLDEIYIIDSAEGKIFLLNSSGLVLREIEIAEAGKVITVRPIALTQDADYNLYLIDSISNSIMITDFTGELKNKWSLPKTLSGQFPQPSGITIDEYKKLFIVDTSNHSLYVTNTSGRIMFKTEEKLSSPNGLKFPTDVAVLPSGIIFISDTGNFRIQVRDPNFRLITYLQWLDEKGMPDIDPFRLAFDSKSNLYFIDRGKNRIIKLSSIMVSKLIAEPIK